MNASNVLGQPNFTSVTYSCTTPTTAYNLCGPNGAFYDTANQRLFIESHGSRILVYNMGGVLSNNMSAIDVVGQVDYLGARTLTSSFTNSNNPSPYGFAGPETIAVDQVHHRLFITDTGSARVLVYNMDSNDHLLDYAADYILGKPNFTSEYDCTTSAANLCSPNGLGYDPVNDRLFVGDYDDERVVVFNLAGGITNGMNASYVIGQPNLSSTATNGCGFPTPAKGICQPDGIVFDPGFQRLFIADASSARVLVYDLSGGLVDDIAPVSVLGQTTTTGSDCTAGPTGLCGPEEIAYDPVRNYLFVAGYNDWRVTVYDLSGGVTMGMNASYVIGQPNFNYGNPCIRNDTHLCNATGISYAPGFQRLYVGNDDRILIYDLSSGITNGMAAEKIIGKADFTNGYSCSSTLTQSNLCSVFGVEMYPTSGYLYSVDYYYNRVTVYDLNLKLPTATLPQGYQSDPYSYTIPLENDAGAHNFTISSGSLTPGLTINAATGQITGTPTASGLFNFTVSAVGTNNSPASQSYSIKTFSHTGYYDASNLVGQVDGSDAPIWTQSATNNNGATSNNGLDYPTGTAIDSVHHRLFVSDEDNNRVLIYNLNASNNLVDHVADHVLGQPDLTSNASGLSASQFGTSYMGLEYDSVHDRLFVADASNNRVLVFNTSTITDGMNADHVLGQPNFTTSSSYPTAQNTMDYPVATGYDAKHDRLFVADSNNSRVLIFDVNPASLTDNENADHVLGQPNFTTSTALTTQSSIQPYYSNPVYDGANERVFIGDYGNNRIMVFNADPATINDGDNATHVLGQPDFTTTNYGTSDTLIDGPQAVAYDASQKLLFVAEYGNNRISIFDANPATIANGESVFGVLGQQDFVSASSNTTQQQLGSADGVSMVYDPSTRQIYVPDSGNNRIMIFSFAYLQTNAPGGVVGSGYNFASSAYTQGAPVFTITSGSLPPGLNLNGTTGVVTGTPTTAGTFNFTISLADDNGISGTFTNSRAYSVLIAPNPSGGGSGPPAGGGSQPPSSNNNSSNPTTPGPVPAIINAIIDIVTDQPVLNLDQQPTFISDSGYSGDTTAGQSYIFTANDNTSHTIVVKEIKDGSVELSIDNGKTVIVLQPGKPVRQNVSGGTAPDITIELISSKNGKAQIKFTKATLGASTVITNNGFGAGNTQAPNTPAAIPQKKKFLKMPQEVLVAFPWLLFILLLITALVFAWSSLQERRREAKYTRQLAWQKSLAEQKHNFITLSAHYFRTPLTLISGGIELLTSLPDGQAIKDTLSKLSQQMTLIIEELVGSAKTSTVDSGTVLPTTQNRKLKIYLIGFLLGSYITVGIIDLILIAFDGYNVSNIILLEQQAAMLLGTVCVLVAWRYWNNKKQLRVNAENLVASQLNLDTARNNLIADSLQLLTTPLKQIKEQLATINNPELSDFAMNGVKRLDEMVDKFKLLTLLSTESLTTAVAESVAIDAVVKAILGKLQPDIQAKQLSVKTNFDTPLVNQNKILLSVAIEALISNAIKYSPKDAEVTINAKRHSDKIELLVADHGPGIADDKTAQILKPFSRVEDASENFDHEGVGLSLYLNTLIMDYLGGSIDFVSHELNKGTTVRLTIPLDKNSTD